MSRKDMPYFRLLVIKRDDNEYLSYSVGLDGKQNHFTKYPMFAQSFRSPKAAMQKMSTVLEERPELTGTLQIANCVVREEATFYEDTSDRDE